MSNLYRLASVESDIKTFDTYHTECGRELVRVDPDLYVYRQGGLSEAFYRCDEDEADGAVFNIQLFSDPNV